jgi:hypothetical protein
VTIAAAILGVVRKNPELLLGIYTMAMFYAAFLVAGRAIVLLDGLWDTGWAGKFQKRAKGDRWRETGSVIIGIMIGGCFWICAIAAAALVYKLFTH